MEITYTATITVTPILIKDKQAGAAVGRIFKTDAILTERNLTIFGHKICTDGLLIYVAGIVGNLADYLSEKINGEIIEESKAIDIEKSADASEIYTDLNKNLTSVYS